MRIDIIMTRNDGSIITLASNVKIESPANGARVWKFGENIEALRGLALDEAWATSYLCASIALARLPVDPKSTDIMRAALVYNEPNVCQRSEDEERGRMLARAQGQRGRGSMSVAAGGDVQFSDQ